jgi:hypothetical protein
MRSTLAIAFLLLCSSTSAAVIEGQVSGITPQAVPWNGIQAGKAFTLTFKIDTSAAALNAVSNYAGPVARDLDHSLFDIKLVVDGDSLIDESFAWTALAGPGNGDNGGTGFVADDAVLATGLLAPDNLFVFTLHTPGAISDPIPNFPLLGFTPSSLAGVTFGYRDADEPETSLILLGENLPITIVPEPSTYALAAIGVIGLLAFRRRKQVA